jgi:hypothetical protein
LIFLSVIENRPDEEHDSSGVLPTVTRTMPSPARTRRQGEEDPSEARLIN